MRSVYLEKNIKSVRHTFIFIKCKIPIRNLHKPYDIRH